MFPVFLLVTCTFLSISNAMVSHEVLYDVVFNITCDNPEISNKEILHNPSSYEIIWVLPSGQLIQNEDAQDLRVQTSARGTKLMIRKVDDPDFGWYRCIIQNIPEKKYFVSSIGVNVDGPYWGDLLEKYKTQIIVGCVAAGIVFFGSIFACIAFHQLCRKKERKNSLDMHHEALSTFDNATYASDYEDEKQSKSDLNSVDVDIDIKPSFGSESNKESDTRM